MIIKSIDVKKFRGFNDVKFDLGKNLTVIAGQNGTQKTTLLGMISQPFTITNEENPMYGEKPLSGGNFRSSFNDKFKLSEVFDKPKGHEWTLYLNNQAESSYTAESSERKLKRSHLRFYKKGDHSKGSGYIQLPVIYLSLSRLSPIGEDDYIDSSNEVKLSEEEFKFYKEWHNYILIIVDYELTRFDYLKSKQKNTLGANTSFYDWKTNSSGQDNIGKILLAIISFKRLMETYPNDYKGGILAIDELDATLYPGAQIKLINALNKFASKFKIQIIFTTHSLSILEYISEKQKNKHFSNLFKIIYLRKCDNQITVIENIEYDIIKDHLDNVIKEKPSIERKKITVFTEDYETIVFAKAILKRKASILNFENVTNGCDTLLSFCKKQIKGFRENDSLIILDGDVDIRKTESFKNVLLLPGGESPDKILATYLKNLPDTSSNWEKIHSHYSRQIAFGEYSYDKIMAGSDGNKSREISKKWFKEQERYWGKGCTKIINLWIEDNKELAEQFINTFNESLKTIL